jgi:magnesium-dependent phosphatase 1
MSTTTPPPTIFPKAIIWDLDGTLWYPEMYHLWGNSRGGSPFRPVNIDSLNTNVQDGSGTVVKLIGDARTILRQIDQEIKPRPKLGIASSTDEPTWARECLDKIIVDGKRLVEYFDIIEIAKGSKRYHLTRIKESLGIEFHEILFLDNESGNINTVAKLGVVSILTPFEGVTKKVFESALDIFRRNYLQCI